MVMVIEDMADADVIDVIVVAGADVTDVLTTQDTGDITNALR